MKILTTVVLVACVGVLARTAWAEDLPLGTWTGTALRMRGDNPNRQPVQLIVKKAPDPHVLWRGGSGELISVVFQLGNANNQREVGQIALAAGRLTFSFTQPDTGDLVNCVLALEVKENAYVGDCGAGLDRRITLVPPPPAVAKPADAKPADAK
jgi:hypothetical protein